MAALNIFQKKEKQKEAEKKIEKTEKEAKIALAFQILKSPHIAEKATELTKKNQYVFKIWPQANKTEVKKAIEELYGVKVLAVKIINVPAKKRRLGRVSGWKRGYKKAIVRIKEGQTIEVMPK